MANKYAELRGREDVLRSVDRIDRVISSGDLISAAGPKIRDAVTRRTQQGIDIDERRFEPYSPAYGALKGRRSPVTLAGTATRSGVRPPEMLNLLEAKKLSRTRGRLRLKSGGRPDRRIVGEAHQKGLGNVPKRKWFGLSKADVKRLDEWVIDWIDTRIRAATTRDSISDTGGTTKGTKAWVQEAADPS